MASDAQRDGPDIVDGLLGEHAVFYHLFDVIETRLDGAAGGGPGPDPDADPGPEGVRALGEVLAALLKRHAQLEEELLFERVEQALGGRAPLDPLRNQHDDIETTLGAALARSGEETAWMLREAIAVCMDHFMQEETQVFPIARDVLDEAALREIGAAWAKAREVGDG